MYNIVRIGEKDIPMLAMASADVDYWHIFHEDPIKLQTAKDLDEGDMIIFIQKMGFVMAKFAEFKNRKEMAKLNEDSFLEWLDQFDTFSIYQILPELIDLWGMNIKTTVPARKN